MEYGTRGGWRAALAAFRHSEDGSATIESLLWFISFFGLIGVVTDGSLAFFGRAEAFRIVQDGNRAFSVGRITTTAQVETFVETALHDIAPHANAVTSVSGGIVTTSVTMPLSDFTLFSDFGNKLTRVSGAHYVE